MSEGAPPRRIDWEAVEQEYRAGQMSVREIGRKHGVNAGTIVKKAKKCEWIQDLSEKVRRETAARLAQATPDGNTDGNPNGNTDGNPDGDADSNPDGNAHGNTHGNTDGDPHGDPDGNTHGNTDGYADSNPDSDAEIKHGNPLARTREHPAFAVQRLHEQRGKARTARHHQQQLQQRLVPRETAVRSWRFLGAARRRSRRRHAVSAG